MKVRIVLECGHSIERESYQLYGWMYCPSCRTIISRTDLITPVEADQP